MNRRRRTNTRVSSRIREQSSSDGAESSAWSQKAVQICEYGRRVYQRGLVAGSEGNLSCRLARDRVLCTPTMACKGFLMPEDLCTVDLKGAQVAGSRGRTSEILLHNELYKGCRDTQAVIHAHPPHVTAFAASGRAIAGGVLPEADLFLGDDIPVVGYETPGTAAFAQLIRPYCGPKGSAVLCNHGAVSWGTTMEEAWFLLEILEAYCRVIWLAGSLGGARPLPAAKRAELRRIRQKMNDKRVPDA